MKKINKKKPFNTLLLTYISESDSDVNNITDWESENIFTKNLPIAISKDKVKTLINSLVNSLSINSLGSLISSKLEKKELNISDLQNEIGLTNSLLDAIKNDMIFPNSIPIKYLIKLIKFLEISLEETLSAIRVTFEKLITENKMFLSTPPSIQPAFRKSIIFDNLTFDYKKIKVDESYLYQNEEALDKYTSRLKELYNEYR